jgi:hypothetical protein
MFRATNELSLRALERSEADIQKAVTRLFLGTLSSATVAATTAQLMSNNRVFSFIPALVGASWLGATWQQTRKLTESTAVPDGQDPMRSHQSVPKPLIPLASSGFALLAVAILFGRVFDSQLVLATLSMGATLAAWDLGVLNERLNVSARLQFNRENIRHHLVRLALTIGTGTLVALAIETISVRARFRWVAVIGFVAFILLRKTIRTISQRT